MRQKFTEEMVSRHKVLQNKIELQYDLNRQEDQVKRSGIDKAIIYFNILVVTSVKNMKKALILSFKKVLLRLYDLINI